MFKKKLTSKEVTRSVTINAIVAALYVVLTVVVYPLSFGAIQFRFAEMLVLLCFFKPDTVFGLVIGCLLANAFSPDLFLWDMLFGTMATLIACIGIVFSPRLLIASIWPVLINGFVVAAELYFVLQLPFWFSVLTVSLGELAVIAASYVIFMFLMRNKGFMKTIQASKHLEVKW